MSNNRLILNRLIFRYPALFQREGRLRMRVAELLKSDIFQSNRYIRNTFRKFAQLVLIKDVFLTMKNKPPPSPNTTTTTKPFSKMGYLLFLSIVYCIIQIKSFWYRTNAPPPNSAPIFLIPYVPRVCRTLPIFEKRNIYETGKVPKLLVVSRNS